MSSITAEMVKNGELRYVYWNADGRGMGTNSEISTWVTSSCSAVQGFDTATQNAPQRIKIIALPKTLEVRRATCKYRSMIVQTMVEQNPL